MELVSPSYYSLPALETPHCSRVHCHPQWKWQHTVCYWSQLETPVLLTWECNQRFLWQIYNNYFEIPTDWSFLPWAVRCIVETATSTSSEVLTLGLRTEAHTETLWELSTTLTTSISHSTTTAVKSTVIQWCDIGHLNWELTSEAFVKRDRVPLGRVGITSPSSHSIGNQRTKPTRQWSCCSNFYLWPEVRVEWKHCYFSITESDSYMQ